MTDRKVVLVADDEEDVQLICKVNLELEGFDTVPAKTGVEALRAARAAAPDVVLLDVMMPEMDGWACLEAMKADASLRGIPVVMVTAKVQHADRLTGLRNGADDYVTKPFHPDQLVDAI